MHSSCDVLIIGGGCMGASVAYHLARRGITNVVLVEREAMLATGSTGRNAGGVRHQFSHDANIRLSIESIRLFERFEEEIGSPIDFHQDGYLFLLSTDEAVATFRANVARQRALGVDVQWLDADEARRVAPGLSTDGVIAATFCQRDGVADPNGVTTGFAKAAQAKGVRILRETEVLGIDLVGGRAVGVRTAGGPLAAGAVVIAAGAWSGGIGRMAGADIPVEPHRRHIFIAQAPADGRSWHVPPTKVLVIDFATSFYFHREGPGVLFGMGDPNERPTFDTTVQWNFLEQVVPVAGARLPALVDASISHAWAGLYEMTPDANPIIGPVDPVGGLYAIAGFSGHGFQHSPAAGRILSDMIAGVDPGCDVRPFAFARFAANSARGEGYVV